MATTGLKTAVSVLIVAAVSVAVWQGVRLRRATAEKDQAKGRPATNLSTGSIAQRHLPQTATNAMLAAALGSCSLFEWEEAEIG